MDCTFYPKEPSAGNDPKKAIDLNKSALIKKS